MLRLLLVGLPLAVMLGCEGSRRNSAGDELSGDWVRVGYPECEGTLPFQELPVERDLIFSSRLTVEQRLDNLTFCVDGLRIVEGRLNGTDILLDGS